MSRVVFLCIVSCFVQKSFSQVIASAPYYSNGIPNGALGLSNGMPMMSTLTSNSPVNGIIGSGAIGNGIAPNTVAMTNSLPSGTFYSTVPSEAAFGPTAATAIASNVANTAINAGIAGLEGFSLGGIPMSGVSPMGYGDVTILGELPVGGSTGVAGNVPVIGYVTFEGTVPAGGTVTLASNCGCSNPTIY